jgi:starch synthase
MKKTRVLFISQEITPYLPESPMSNIGRHLPQGIQEKGKEIRTFMPRYGCINERRHQLHEVIRLSGMNLIIDDTDHPLIIKVASIQPARMQVYFIDNEEYFQRKTVLTDEDGNLFADNDERSIFFCRGVLETVKKLGWAPDVIHCHGWMTALVPMFLKKAYNDDPLFANSKVVYSVYDEAFNGKMNKDYASKAVFDSIAADDLSLAKEPTFNNISKLAMEYADAVVIGSEGINSDLESHIKDLSKPVLGYQSEDEYIEAYSKFYDEVVEETSVMAE